MLGQFAPGAGFLPATDFGGLFGFLLFGFFFLQLDLAFFISLFYGALGMDTGRRVAGFATNRADFWLTRRNHRLRFVVGHSKFTRSKEAGAAPAMTDGRPEFHNSASGLVDCLYLFGARSLGALTNLVRNSLSFLQLIELDILQCGSVKKQILAGWTGNKSKSLVS